MSKNKNTSDKKPSSSEAEKKEYSENLAKLTTNSLAGAAIVIHHYNGFDNSHLPAFMGSLAAQMDSIGDNDLTQCESMLFGQAHALQAIFVTLAQRSTSQQYMKNMESYLRLALKAQNQSRMTLETLANIKNPPVVYAKQANISHGHQQVNNGAPATNTSTQAEKNISQQNELLEEKPHEQEWLDTRAPSATSTTDSTVAAMAKIDRSKKPRRQKAIKP
jgi:hypothetical protein